MLPGSVTHLVAHYIKKQFVEKVCALERGLALIGKLRCDANLRHFYRGTYPGRGRPKRFDGKMNFGEVGGFIYEGEVDKELHVYTQTLWHMSFKRTVRVVLLLNTTQSKPRYSLLFTTDLLLSGCEVLEL